MRAMVIDGGMMPSRDAAHEYLRVRLGFPEYYGGNLDALYDLLTAWPEAVTLVVYRREVIEDALGRYGTDLLRTLEDAGKENPLLTVVYDGDAFT